MNNTNINQVKLMKADPINSQQSHKYSNKIQASSYRSIQGKINFAEFFQKKCSSMKKVLT